MGGLALFDVFVIVMLAARRGSTHVSAMPLAKTHLISHILRFASRSLLAILKDVEGLMLIG